MNHNAWRWNLHPRDPNYLAPPTDEEQEQNDELAEMLAEDKSYED
jgi:hypothetical protein